MNILTKNLMIDLTLDINSIIKHRPSNLHTPLNPYPYDYPSPPVLSQLTILRETNNPPTKDPSSRSGPIKLGGF